LQNKRKRKGNQQTKKNFASTSSIFARPDLPYGNFEKCQVTAL